MDPVNLPAKFGSQCIALPVPEITAIEALAVGVVW